MKIISWKYFIYFSYIIFSIVWVNRITMLIEVDIHDEISIYILEGLKFFNTQSHSLATDWAPYYSIWYGLLQKIQPDLLELYFLNRIIVLPLTSLFFLIYLNKVGLNFSMALICSLLFILNPYFLTIGRGPNHFAIFVLTFFLCCADFFKDKLIHWCLISLGFFVASYVRPEYFSSFVILYFLNFTRFLIHLKKISIKKRVIILSFFLSFFLIKSYFKGPPFKSSEAKDSKSISVFILKNYERYQEDKRYRPETINSIAIFNLYGNPQHLGEALINNPREFTTHIFYNALQYFKMLSKMLYSYEYLIRSNFVYSLVVVSLFFIIFIFRSKFLKGKINDFILEKLTFPERKFYFVTVLACLPIFISSFIFGPLHQYIIGQLPFLLTLIIIGIFSIFKIIWKKYFA